MLEYMQNRCDNTGKTQKRKLQEKVVRITTSSCQRLKKRKEKKAVQEALACKHQFICYLRMLIKEKWCKAFSWMNAY